MYVLRKMSSSFSRSGTVVSESSFQRFVLGPIPLAYNLFSYCYS